ncbi:MAG: hypothetical protein MJ178_05190 [Treponemataceae bacterium]|nr:hypothetical protein [Treponemataceae bacterium]
MKNILKTYRNTCRKYAAKAEEQLKGLTVAGHLRANNTPDGPKYFHVTRIGDTKGRYLRVASSPADRKLAESLAHRDYLKQIYRLSRQWDRAITRFLHDAPDILIKDISADNPARRALVQPIAFEMTDEEYIRNWLSKPAGNLPFHAGAPVIYTDQGQRVRSKSEKIIADKLNQLHIPYRYEVPLRLKDRQGRSIIIHPDFTILNVATRQEMYFEHFGLMNDEKYRTTAFEKLAAYQRSGYYPGHRLLCTFEGTDAPLDSRSLEQMLKSVFKY